VEKGSKFNRFIRVRFDGTEVSITDLKMVFRIQRFHGDAHHTMELDIYNLGKIKSENNYLEIGTVITLEAGYKDFNGVLFIGKINNTNEYREGVDFITRIYCNDGRDYNSKMISFGWTRSIALNDVLSDIASTAGILIVKNNIKINNISGGYTVHDTFDNIMNTLSESYNFNWYIINGDLFLYDSEKGNDEKELFEVSAGTGLIETPVLLTKGGISVKMLMEPSINNGDLFDVKSKGLTLTQQALEYSNKFSFGLGRQKVLSMAHTGDTHGDAWYTELIGLRLN